MAGKQAKTLSIDHIDDLLFFAERSRHPLRNRLIVLLSVKAGLRAAEIRPVRLIDPFATRFFGEDALNSAVSLGLAPS